MSRPLLQAGSIFRIFAVSSIMTVAVAGGIFLLLGPMAAIITLILIVVEVMFSFENAIINARVLASLSPFWQRMFLTIGIVIAVFGMRVLFPVIIVALSTHLSMARVVALAMNDPRGYADALQQAAPDIETFGGMFLLMLAAQFFISPDKHIHWLSDIERPLAKAARRWTYVAICVTVLAVIVLLPMNPHPLETLLAGGIGVMAYLLIHGISEILGRSQPAASGAVRTGMLGVIGFVYLEVLDASFSLDGVIGAFAVTNSVLLIAAGLGAGAIWVRSLTVYMVHKKTLETYRFIEHGAHYTVLALALVLLLGLFVPVPGVIVGFAGIIIIGVSIVASLHASRLEEVVG